jgi:outer membrane lipoprotein SlyB
LYCFKNPVALQQSGRFCPVIQEMTSMNSTIKKTCVAIAMALALPVAAQAQSFSDWGQVTQVSPIGSRGTQVQRQCHLVTREVAYAAPATAQGYYDSNGRYYQAQTGYNGYNGYNSYGSNGYVQPGYNGYNSYGSNGYVQPGYTTDGSGRYYRDGNGYYRDTNGMYRDGDGSPNIAGTAIGAVVGGAIGNQIGGGDGKRAATVAGVLLGGVIGNNIERRHEQSTYDQTRYSGGSVYNGQYTQNQYTQPQRVQETVCVDQAVAVGRILGYRARVNANGRLYDQSFRYSPQVGSRVRLDSSASFVGYDRDAAANQPTGDWGDRYQEGYPYAERY